MATRWHPDTCACVLEYDYDPKEDKFHSHKVVELCKLHKKHANNSRAHYEAVVSHNRANNNSGR